jgi:hypothetical protein
MRKLLLLALVFYSTFNHADGLRIGVSDDAVSFVYNSSITEKNTSMEVAWIHNSNKNRDLLSGGFFINGIRGEVSGRLGGKLYWSDIDYADGYGIALGGEGAIKISPQLSVNAKLYWGPGSLSWSDLEGYSEWAVEANFEAFNNAILTAGYGSLEVDADKRDNVSINEGMYVGMKLSF